MLNDYTKARIDAIAHDLINALGQYDISQTTGAMRWYYRMWEETDLMLALEDAHDCGRVEVYQALLCAVLLLSGYSAS